MFQTGLVSVTVAFEEQMRCAYWEMSCVLVCKCRLGYHSTVLETIASL